MSKSEKQPFIRHSIVNTLPDNQSRHSAPGTETPKRIFVVGATGYIGKFVTRELAARGHKVVSFARDRKSVV